jgi:hypothetical protein
VAEEEARQERVGSLDRGDPREAQLGHEPVLERAPEPLDPTLGLWTAGPDPGDPGLIERPSDLGEAAPPGELLGEGRGPVALDDEDPIAVRVDPARQPELLGRLGEGSEVAGGILRDAERPAGHSARRVVDRAHERRERKVGPEPAMAAAIGLEEHALADHPLAPAAVAWRPTGADRADRGLGEDPPEGALGDDEPVALGEQLGQVRVVHLGIGPSS